MPNRLRQTKPPPQDKMNQTNFRIDSLANLTTIAWNMGGGYSPYGQRCAAASVPGGVYFVDLDRGLDYYFPHTQLEKSAIRHAYLHNGGFLPLDADSPVSRYQLRDHLEGLAKGVPARF